jgi:hypothetical protein
MASIREKSATWHQAVAICSLPFILIGVGFTFFPNESNERSQGIWLLIFSVPSFIGSIVMYFIAYGGRDIEPDFLARLVDPKQLLHLGDAHLWLACSQIGDHLLLKGLIQNTKNGSGECRLNLTVKRGAHVVGVPEIELSINLNSSEIVALIAPIPLRSCQRNELVKFLIGGKCRISGDRIRYARHRAVAKPMNIILMIILGLKGHIASRGGTYLYVDIKPGNGTLALQDSKVATEHQTVWSPGDANDLAELSARLQEFASGKLD